MYSEKIEMIPSPMLDKYFDEARIPSKVDFTLESLDQNDLHQVYAFVDQVPINKPKKNLNRDFSDCRLMAEVIKYYLPTAHKGMIDVNNYIETHQVKIKKQNWSLLNKKVLSKMGKMASF